MLLRLLLTAASWLLLIQYAFACDVCGNASNGATLGVLPHHQRSFLSWRTTYQQFKAVGSSFESASVDRFLQTHLIGRYSFGKRWQVIGILPYASNQRSHNNLKINGLGDISVVVNYTVLNTMDSVEHRFQHHLMAGIGIKTPTGDFSMNNTHIALVPANLRAGTGSWDYSLNLLYTLRNNRLALTTALQYRFNTENDWTYRFGDQFSAMLFAGYPWQHGKIVIQPFVGAAMDWATSDSFMMISQPHTGGSSVQGLVGVEMGVKNFSVGANVQLPFWQDYADGNLTNQGRFTVSLSYLF